MTLATTYDAVFRDAGAGKSIPVPFIRALSYAESALNPLAQNPGSSATGLLQVIDATRADYNKRNGTTYSREDMTDPLKGSIVGIDELWRVINSYATNHPRSLSPNWNDPRYVALVAQGFNAGWSEQAGVGKVVGALEAQGIDPSRITVDTVGQAAPLVGGSRYLSEPDRIAHAHRVAELYMSQPDAPLTVAQTVRKGDGGILWPVLIGLGLALAIGSRSR